MQTIINISFAIILFGIIGMLECLYRIEKIRNRQIILLCDASRRQLDLNQILLTHLGIVEKEPTNENA